jgi:hypothetical protein
MTPCTDDDQRIRKGLQFLTRADRSLLRVAAPLERLVGKPNSQGIADPLKNYSFAVGRKNYTGRMTKEQRDYLQGYTGSLRRFADAIARVLLKMNGKVVEVLRDLKAVSEAPARLKAGRVLPLAATGCCTYDTNQMKDGVTQTFCEVGLQGQWSPNPCGGQAQPKRKGLARGAR